MTKKSVYIFTIFLMSLLSLSFVSAELYAHYTFDGAGGGTGVNGITSVPGKVGNAFEFGSDSQDSVALGDILDLGAIDITFTFWLKDFDFGQNHIILSKGDANNGVGYEIRGNSDGTTKKIIFRINDGTSKRYIIFDSTKAGSQFDGTKWNEFRWVMDRDGMMQLYVNGNLEGEVDISTIGEVDNTNDLMIGCVDTTGDGKCNNKLITSMKIDDLKYYKGAYYSNTQVNIIADYNFDLGVKDSSENLNDLSNVKVSFSDGEFGKKANFNGADSYLYSNSEDFEMGKENFAISFLAKNLLLEQNDVIIGKGNENGASEGYRIIGNADTGYYLRVYDGSKGASSKAIKIPEDGKWHLLTYVLDRKTKNGLKSYLDGVLIETGVDATGIGGEVNAVGKRFAIGRNSESNGGYIKGLLDNVRIYKKALSTDEVRSLYEEAELNKCFDNDGGLNYYVKGTTTNMPPEFKETWIDKCLTDTKLQEGTCTEGLGINTYECPNGCKDGACLPTIMKTNDCRYLKKGDSINATNYKDNKNYEIIVEGIYRDGAILKIDGNQTGKMEGGDEYKYSPQGDKIVVEHFSYNEKKSNESKIYLCNRGATTNFSNIRTCPNMMNFLKKPTDIRVEGNLWKIQRAYSWEHNGNNDYSVSYSKDDGNYIYMKINVQTINKSHGLSIQKKLESSISYRLCEKETIMEQEVYICLSPYNLAMNSQQVEEDDYIDKNIYWTTGNKLFRVYYSGNRDYWNCWDYESCQNMEENMHRESQRDIIDVLENLINNQPELVGGLYIDWDIEQVVQDMLGECNSDLVTNGSCSSWSCIFEPIICPPHGFQTQTCSRNCYQEQEDEVITSELQCSPGMCSGCYIPRWFGGWELDNTCIPYGFRFGQQIGWTLKDIYYEDNDDELLSVEEAEASDDVDLIVYPNNTALLSLEITQNEYVDIYLEEGKEYDWGKLTGHGSTAYNATLMAIEINYNSNVYEESYIDVLFTRKGFRQQNTPEVMNAYCDIDGKIKEQKTIDSQGEWAKCQNSYECSSNLCSDGECLEPSSLFEQVGFFKRLFVSGLCRITNLFSSAGYGKCILNYLGN